MREYMFEGGVEEGELSPHEGTGLGLTISRELAALHGGDLRLVPGEGANEGSGAVFELRLPA